MRRRVAFVLAPMLLLTALASCAGGSTPERSATLHSTSTTVEPIAAHAPVPARHVRVLLLGDSILDQEGSAAAFLLRQAGVDAKVFADWGTGLLSIDQYDYGKTKLSGLWFAKARRYISEFDPDVVGVYLNHSYWPPYPHDAAGRTINDLWSPSAQQMIAQQARAFITTLRSRGAKVFFISPVPAGSIGNPDPNVWNPIWHGYVPVLRAMHVTVANPQGPLAAPNGLRSETSASCNGSQQRVRPPVDVHLTRFGAGLAGTGLAQFVADVVHASVGGNAAPGESTAALVPTSSGRGYWLVGCDGSVYHFGDAAHLTGARATFRNHGGVVAAVASPRGAGLWLVAGDGTITPVGAAPRLTWASRPAAPIVAAAANAGGNGLLATTAAGVVSSTSGLDSYGDLRALPSAGTVAGIEATRDGGGYWLVTTDGRVFGFGDARTYASARLNGTNGSVVGLAPTPDDHGYWLVDRRGEVSAFGDARYLGGGVWVPPPGPNGAHVAAPGPSRGIVAAPGTAPGYWIFGTTGRVVARGAAARYGGDNNLARDTQ